MAAGADKSTIPVEVAKAFAMHAEGWEFIQAWTSHSSGDWLFFRRPKTDEPIDIRSL